ncbi:S8 family serine peptidase [Mycobacterium lehmannii]|uniref:S8 family serine peptidase n=1 Tax=Mycobacterium lehmannii TaxID=2048550 RepID=UPI000B94598A|nr:S8 family serine peptidase [Mycobacterium lehmannii]
MRAKSVAAALAASGLLTANLLAPPAALAVAPPVIDPAALPPDETPGPAQEMRQTKACIEPVVVGDPNVTQPDPGNTMLNIEQAWQYSTGAGVTVAIIDTGVTPNPRFPRLFPGGDYVQGLANGGLTDCESHGTIVASIIGAAPSNPADRPTPRPAGVSAPPPPPDVAANPAPPAFPPPPTITATATVTAPAPPPPPPPPAGPPPAQGPADTGAAQPLVPGPPPGGPDGVVGVAPDAALISIRQSSTAFTLARPSAGDVEGQRKAGDIVTLAKAIRHAADLPGVQVINVSLASCINAAAPVNQDPLGAAVRYAAVDKDIVIVAAAGNKGEPQRGQDCGQNPAFDPLNPEDPRDWAGVRTIVTPAWFSNYVLAVGAVTPEGLPLPDSINGPWVSVAAPGWRIMGLANTNGAAVNARPDEPGLGAGFWGTSFSAAYVSGVVALVRAKFPDLTAAQVIRRITETAHNPARGVDNKVGYGVIDPVAALTFDVPLGDPKPVERLSTDLYVPPPDPGPDLRPRNTALIGGAAVLLIAGGVLAVTAMRRRLQ